MTTHSSRRQIVIVLIGRFLSDFGRGFTGPYFSLYFADEVGLSVTTVSIGFFGYATMGALAVLGGAYFTDRFGRRKCLIFSTFASAISYASFPWATTAATYILVSTLAGGSHALYWPASNAMLTDLSAPAERARVFAWMRMAANAGIGLGSVCAGLLLTLSEHWFESSQHRYHLLFYVDSATYLVFSAILVVFVRESLTREIAERYEGFARGWGTTMRDRHILALVPLNVAFVLCFSLFFVGFAIFFKRDVGLREFDIAIVFALNTAICVFLQASVWSLVESWPRTRTLCAAAALFGVGLLVLNFCAIDALNGLAVVLVAVAIFTLGELLHGPAMTSLFANLAPETLRGTYMSVFALCWSLGLGFGPIVSGWLLDREQPYFLWNGLAITLCFAAAGLALLGRSLPSRVNRPQA